MSVSSIHLDHQIDAAHRVVGHEGGTGKCARLHGHTYMISVDIQAAEVNEIGFIVDFAAIKNLLNEWDHRCLLWTEDPLFKFAGEMRTWSDFIVLPFNPTSENMANYLAKNVLDLVTQPCEVFVKVSETPKTWATARAWK